jgi:two-component system chemotaxis response regulator CheY
LKDTISVLIVDDERIQRNIVKNMTIELGKEYHFQVNVVEASNGAEAITKLGDVEIDLVLLDWNLPYCSGGEFIRMIRSLEKCQDLPIVVISSETSQKTIIAALKEGATEYIIKPVDGVMFRKKMVAVVQSILWNMENRAV